MPKSVNGQIWRYWAVWKMIRVLLSKNERGQKFPCEEAGTEVFRPEGTVDSADKYRLQPLSLAWNSERSHPVLQCRTL
jgi:hypothetical protein